jgi:hypothetical protein
MNELFCCLYQFFDFGRILQKIATQILVLAIIHNSTVFEDVEMLGDVRLGGFEEVFDVIHTSFTAQQHFHNVKSEGMG